ncbi:8419_t:CDS:2, partial [Cetraspora pellucida]
SWLEVLLEAQQEVLQEIQDILGKKIKINELEIQIKNLKIQEQEASQPE